MGGVAKRGKRSRKILSKIFGFSTWKVLLVLILMCFVAATLLRIDHLEMSRLKDAVMEADKNGSDEEIADALIKLQEFTHKHIIFNKISFSFCNCSIEFS